MTPDFTTRFSFQIALYLLHVVKQKENLTLHQVSLGALFRAPFQFRQPCQNVPTAISCRLLYTGLHYEPSSRQGDLMFAAYFSCYAAYYYRTFSQGCLRVLVLKERGKLEYLEKNLSEQGENQQQTQPTCDTGSGNGKRATLVGGKYNLLSPLCYPCSLGDSTLPP